MDSEEIDVIETSSDDEEYLELSRSRIASTRKGRLQLIRKGTGTKRTENTEPTSSESGWGCPRCTYLNDRRLKRCAMCAAPQNTNKTTGKGLARYFQRSSDVKTSASSLQNTSAVKEPTLVRRNNREVAKARKTAVTGKSVEEDENEVVDLNATNRNNNAAGFTPLPLPKFSKSQQQDQEHTGATAVTMKYRLPFFKSIAELKAEGIDTLGSFPSFDLLTLTVVNLTMVSLWCLYGVPMVSRAVDFDRLFSSTVQRVLLRSSDVRQCADSVGVSSWL